MSSLPRGDLFALTAALVDIPSVSHEEAAITVVMRDRRLETLQGGGDAALPADCLPGEAIRLGRHEFRLIRVGGE